MSSATETRFPSTDSEIEKANEETQNAELNIEDANVETSTQSNATETAQDGYSKIMENNNEPFDIVIVFVCDKPLFLNVTTDCPITTPPDAL